ncbi:hypothetical protein J31TS4_22000 [Paenibacillus sp. J31TS4]|uniref:DUF1516 family protein n=1 Tax=Paenibacillus sp. J31TS4 TaxID=2807195 RepID=UPI001B13CD35|nr:DUF1516 family protein [Paenibacillus sp. J31TS4]GIP38920.1 hypothetical protein J31TS4_22000 [Paenibacillus sp. J31TS4]
MSDSLFNIFYQSHAGSWAFIFLLFLLSVIFRRQKVTGMILRLFYIIMVVSGVGMLIGLGFPAMYVIKGILAIILIGLMEMILGRMKRGEAKGGPMPVFWVLLVVLAVVVPLMGFGKIG